MSLGTLNVLVPQTSANHLILDGCLAGITLSTLSAPLPRCGRDHHQPGDFKELEFSLSEVCRLKNKVLAGAILPGDSEHESIPASLLASGCCWSPLLPVGLRLLLHHLCLHSASTSGIHPYLSLRVSFPLLTLTRTLVIRLSAHGHPACSHGEPENHYSSKGHSLKFLRGGILQPTAMVRPI